MGGRTGPRGGCAALRGSWGTGIGFAAGDCTEIGFPAEPVGMDGRRAPLLLVPATLACARRAGRRVATVRALRLNYLS